jgi:hypothetical protein
MASKKKKVAKAAVAAKSMPFDAGDLANITRANPYIQRLIQDSELRNNVRAAVDESRAAFERLTSVKAPQKAVVEDKKFQGHVREAAFAVRDAVLALNDAPKHPTPRKSKKAKKGGFGLGKLMILALVGAGAALGMSEGLRSKVLDTLFGSEEEFQYTPPAGTPAPPTASPVTAA